MKRPTLYLRQPDRLPLQLCLAYLLGLILFLIGVMLMQGQFHASLPLHVGLALALLAGLVASAHLSVDWRTRLRCLLAIGTVFTLYSTLTPIILEVVPWRADAGLEQLDRRMFGGSPALFFQSLNTPIWIAFFSAVYGLYIPYILFASLHHGVLNKSQAARSQFTTGFIIVYLTGFIGYVLAPAQGPLVLLAGEFAEPIRTGWLHGLIVDAVNRGGGPHGALPSLHVATSLFILLFDFRNCRWRAWLWLLVVLLIPPATVALRYHYVTDLWAGALIALAAYWISARLNRHFYPNETSHENTPHH